MPDFELYLDDSSDPDGWLVLAGYIANPETWKVFINEWRELKLFGSLRPDGERHFKMAEMALSPDRLDRVRHFARVIDRHPIQGVSCRIHIQSIRNALSRIFVPGRVIVSKSRKLAYELCYFTIIDNLCKARNVRDKRPIRDILKVGPDDTIEFIFDEESDKKSLLSSFVRGGARSDQPSPRFENDRDFLPIQAADFLAWHIRKSAKSPTVLGTIVIKINWSHLDFKPEDLSKGIVDMQMSEDQIAHVVATLWRTRIRQGEQIRVLERPQVYSGPWGFRLED